jgi:hypothetical protein
METRVMNVESSKKYKTSAATQMQRKTNAQRRHKTAMLKLLQEQLNLMTNTDLMLEKVIDGIAQIFTFETLVKNVFPDEYQEFVKHDPNVVCIIHERNELHANKTQLMHDISSLKNELEMCRRELDALNAKVKRSKMKQCMQEVEGKQQR